MSRRKWYKWLLIACLAAGAAMMTIHVLSQPGPNAPGPDDPEWWLNCAIAQAYRSTDSTLPPAGRADRGAPTRCSCDPQDEPAPL
ncbi:MAG: hypothetical protein HQ592_15315 [Planctomycetes bacterium]|nr:hypothetical protein [Planctomycetota bacterium]